MRCTRPALLTAGLLLLAVAGCARHDAATPVPSVTALQEDPILLDRVLSHCNADPSQAGSPECVNARAAAERRSGNEDAARARRAEAGFEAAREARRRADEAARQSKEALERGPGPYELPVEGEGAKPPP